MATMTARFHHSSTARKALLFARRAEWIGRGDGDGNEPWVVVGGVDGVITHRFDNVAAQAALDAAIQEVLA